MTNKELDPYTYLVLHEQFNAQIEWLEKFIEIFYQKEFPDWERHKQIKEAKLIFRKDIYDIPERCRNAMATSIFLFSFHAEDDINEAKEKDFLVKEFQQEFYKWIDMSGITPENCPNFLKSIIFEIHEVIKGNWQKIRHDKENRKRGIEIDDPKYLEMMNKGFEAINKARHEENKKAQNLAGKKWQEIEIKTRFKGNAQAGEKTFQEIANSLVNHQEFYFVEQKNDQGKWKKEPTKTTTIQKKASQNQEEKKNPTNNENNRGAFFYVGISIFSGIIILLIGWMVIRKKKQER